MKVGSRQARLSAAIFAVLSTNSALHAGTSRNLIWDPSGNSAPTGSDGSGNWDLTSPNWVDTTTTPPSNTVWSDSNPDSAIFGTSTTTTPGTGVNPYNVFISDNITAQNITLGASANGSFYNIVDQGGGSLTLAGNVTKSVAYGAPQFQLTNPLTLTAGDHVFSLRDTPGDLAELQMNSAITGAGSLTLNNAANSSGYDQFGTLLLSVNNSYTGGTNINDGRLILLTSGGLGTGTATIGAQGELSIGGAGAVTASSLNVTTPINITRSVYTGTNFGDYTDAISSDNPGNAGKSVTFSGPFTVDSTDARVSANTSTITISSDIQQGPDVTSGVLTLDGDFAGFVNLTGNNTALAGGIKIMGGVEVNVDKLTEIGGGAAPKLTLAGGTFHPVGEFITDFSSVTLTNNGTGPTALGTLSGGVDVETGKTFNVSGLYGNSLGSRGGGTLNFNGTNVFGGTPFFDAGTVNINGSTTFGSFRQRSSVLNVGSGDTLTTTNSFSDIGSDSPDNGTLNLTGTGQLIAGSSDFNVTDNANTKGTLNVSDTAVFTSAGHIFVAKSAGSVAAINQSGGTINANGGGQFSLSLGSSSNNNTVPGSVATYTKTGGTLNVAGEMYVGNQVGSTGTFTQSAGATTVNSWFVVGRGGATGTLNLTGGTFTRHGGGNSFIGENINTVTSTVTVSGTGVFNDASDGGEFWVGQGGGSGILNIGTAAGQATNADSAASFTVNNWLAVGRASGSSVGVINEYGGTLTKVVGSNGFFAIGSGGTGTFNQTGGIANIDGTRLGEASSGTANISGGTDVFTGEFSLGANDGLVGTLNISGTANVTVPAVIFGVNSTTAGAGGVLNLNGGTLTGTSFTAGASATALRTFTFNGGTLQPSADSTNFIGAKITSIDSTGGAKINTNGHAITVGSALTHNSALTAADGGLAVSGIGGTLTLSAVNTYTGPTAVTGTAALAITSTGSIATTTLNSTTAIANNGTISESGGGAIDSITGSGTLNVTGGTLGLTNPTLGTLNTQTALNLSGSGTLDIHKNQIQVSGDQYTTLASAYVAGHLTSSDAALASTTRIVGIRYDGTNTTARYTTYGDVNLDGKFNFTDVALINGANNFGGPAGSATYATGDTNYDGRFNFADVSKINGANTFGTGPITSSTPTSLITSAIAPTTDNSTIDLKYDPSTGNLSVITNGLAYGTITLTASQSVFKDGVFGTSPEFYSDDSGVGMSLGFGVLTGQQTANVVLPGVLDPNQSLATLLADITVTADTNGPALSRITFSSTGAAVPEPATFSLLALSAGGLLGRRRRKI